MRIFLKNFLLFWSSALVNKACLSTPELSFKTLGLKEYESMVYKINYSHLFNKRGGWNKRGGGAKVAKSLNDKRGGWNKRGGRDFFGKN